MRGRARRTIVTCLAVAIPRNPPDVLKGRRIELQGWLCATAKSSDGYGLSSVRGCVDEV
jgi:hypothetical protein